MGAPRRLAANGLRLLTRFAPRSGLPRAGCWVEVLLEGALSERTHRGYGGAELGLLDLLRCFEAAGTDDRVEGVLLRVRGDLGSFSQALSLRRAIDGLREASKSVVAFAEQLSAEQYLFASGADRVWLPESGSLYLVGLRTERFYLRDLLDRIGAKPEVVHIGRFKSAGETFTRGGMSDEEREQIEGWQADVYDELIGSIAEGRDLEPEAVRDLVDRGPYGARAAVEAGLADDLIYEDEVLRALEALAREPAPGRRARHEVHLVPAPEYFRARFEDAAWQPVLRPRPTLVYLLGEGGVHRGSGLRGLTSEGTGELLEQLRTEPAVRGVGLAVLGVDFLQRVAELVVRADALVHEQPLNRLRGQGQLAQRALEPGGVDGPTLVDAGRLEPGLHRFLAHLVDLGVLVDVEDPVDQSHAFLLRL